MTLQQLLEREEDKLAFLRMIIKRFNVRHDNPSLTRKEKRRYWHMVDTAIMKIGDQELKVELLRKKLACTDG